MTHDSGQGARIFLADDHPAVLDGLSTLLAGDDHVICGVAVSIQEALDTIDGCNADIAVVDLSLCGESGLDLITLMKERNIPVLVYSIHEDSSTLQRALERGADGYVAKREASEVLLEAVQHVLAGKRYVSPRVAANLESDAPVAGTAWNTGHFSEREQQIMALLGRGRRMRKSPSGCGSACAQWKPIAPGLLPNSNWTAGRRCVNMPSASAGCCHRERGLPASGIVLLEIPRYPE